MTEATIYTVHVDAGRESHVVLATHNYEQAIAEAKEAFVEYGCNPDMDFGAFTETAWVEYWLPGAEDSRVGWNAKGADDAE